MDIWKHIREKRDGFTLIEVLAVLVIIAILAAVAIPTMSGFITDAKKKSYTLQARNVYVAAQAAALDMEGVGEGNSAEGTVVYSRGDGSKYIEKVESFLGDDVESGSTYTITLAGSKVEIVEYTPENGKKITITGGEGVTYED